MVFGWMQDRCRYIALTHIVTSIQSELWIDNVIILFIGFSSLFLLADADVVVVDVFSLLRSHKWIVLIT